ncbi:DUF484 family protein [Undibacterium arcticum]
MTTALDSATVAQYLAENPLFFPGARRPAGASPAQQSADGSRGVAAGAPDGSDARKKYKALELRMAELLHMAQDNDAITHKLHLWTRALLLARNDVDLPYTLIDGLRTIFDVPQVTLRMWRVAPDYSHTWFVQDVSDDTRLFANGLVAPYCGTNNDFEAVRWLDGADQVRSTAILPLRVDGASDAFGLLILGSPDPQRFTAAMATDFLGHIGDTSSAALACLLD